MLYVIRLRGLAIEEPPRDAIELLESGRQSCGLVN